MDASFKAKWDILELAMDDVYGLWELGRDDHEVKKGALIDLVRRGFVDIWHDLAELTGEVTERGHLVSKNTSFPVKEAEMAIRLVDDEAN